MNNSIQPKRPMLSPIHLGDVRQTDWEWEKEILGMVQAFAYIRTECLQVSNNLKVRHQLNRDTLDDLGHSISSTGMLQPMVVRKLPDGLFEVVVGQRRLLAARDVGIVEVPCILTDCDNSESIKLSLIENIERVNLSPIEVARSVQTLICEYGYTQKELATQISMSASSISHHVRLLSLPQTIIRMLDCGILSLGHGKALLGSKSVHQLDLALRTQRENWSVRRLEVEVYNQNNSTETKSELLDTSSGYLSDFNSGNADGDSRDYAKTAPVPIASLIRKSPPEPMQARLIESNGVSGKVELCFSNQEERKRIDELLRNFNVVVVRQFTSQNARVKNDGRSI